MPKTGLRQAMLARRKSVSPAEKSSASLLIQRAFLDSEEYARARVVALYSPVRGEVDTSAIFHEALLHCKTVIYPVVCGENLSFHRTTSLADFQSGAFGILEPCAIGAGVMPDEADVIVIPGVAFDFRGNRIGYGKGYFDRSLHHLEGKGRLVGLCYDFQLVPEIVGEPHDVCMDVIITEKRVIRPRD